jgi:hypothetical protein
VNDTDIERENSMRKRLLILGAIVAALACAGTAAAADGGAEVVRDEGCVTSPFATTCTVVRTTTNLTVTPSGNVSYVTNGTVERQMTFVFGGSYTVTSSLHSHALRKQGEVKTSSDHYYEVSEYVSGTYHLSCVNTWDLHWTNDTPQFTNYELECTVV